MIEKRKYLYKRDTVGGVRETDYLRTQLITADIEVDREMTITDSLQYRPDLVSRLAYGNFNYGWLIMDFNDILDPYEELVVGKVLRIPRLESYFRFFNDVSTITKEDRRDG